MTLIGWNLDGVGKAPARSIPDHIWVIGGDLAPFPGGSVEGRREDSIYCCSPKAWHWDGEVLVNGLAQLALGYGLPLKHFCGILLIMGLSLEVGRVGTSSHSLLGDRCTAMVHPLRRSARYLNRATILLSTTTACGGFQRPQQRLGNAGH